MARRYDFSNPRDVFEFNRRVRLSFRAITGQIDGWDDCAQDIIRKFLEGNGHHQRIDFAIIDYLRRESGDARQPGYMAQRRLMTAKPFEDQVSRNPWPQVARLIDMRFLVNQLSGKQKAIAHDYFIEGMTMAEIATNFKVCESRIWQILGVTVSRMRLALTEQKIKKQFHGRNNMNNENLPHAQAIVPTETTGQESNVIPFPAVAPAKEQSNVVNSDLVNGNPVPLLGMKLSYGEIRVCALLMNGLSNKQIADSLFVTDKTVKFHFTNTFKKLKVKTRLEAYKLINELYASQIAKQAA